MQYKWDSNSEDIFPRFEGETYPHIVPYFQLSEADKGNKGKFKFTFAYSHTQIVNYFGDSVDFSAHEDDDIDEQSMNDDISKGLIYSVDTSMNFPFYKVSTNKLLGKLPYLFFVKSTTGTGINRTPSNVLSLDFLIDQDFFINREGREKLDEFLEFIKSSNKE